MKKRVTVLVIEDDDILRQSLTDYLEDSGYEVCAAENGREGIELFTARNFNVVLTDLRMPEVDGLDVLRTFSEYNKEIPLIVVSGTGDIRDVVEAMRLGAWDYILKPVNEMEVLNHSIKTVLERAALLKENREYQQHLEKLIDERTVSLQKANDELTGINKRLQKVVEATRGLMFWTNLNDFLRKLLEEFCRNMSASGGSIYKIEGNGLVLIHSIEKKHQPDFLPFPLEKESLFYNVLKTKKPVLLKDISKQTAMLPSGWKGYTDGSVISFPLSDDSKSIMGVLSIHNKKEPPFVEQDLYIGTILASHCNETLKAIYASESLKKSEARFREMADLLPEAIFELNDDLSISYVNRKAVELFGYLDVGIRDYPEVQSFIVPEEREAALANMKLRLNGERIGNREYRGIKKDGKIFSMLLNMIPITRNGDARGFRGVAVDITEQKKMEEDLRTSLKEKEILLLELHHRVKNNLQLISSLTDLQMMYDDEKSGEQELAALARRIRVFSDIHNSLYQYEQVTRINFEIHLENAFNALVYSYVGTYCENYKLKLECSTPYLDLNTAVPCGLLLNELMTNSVRNASGEACDVQIKIKHDSEGKISSMFYEDDSMAVPVEETGFSSILIESMATQLGLHMTADNTTGNMYIFNSEKGGKDSSPAEGCILVIENNIFDAMRRISELKKNGFTVDENIFTCGEDAIRYYKDRREKPALIIIEYILSGKLNGIQTAVEIKQISPELPVVFLADNPDSCADKKTRDVSNSVIVNKAAKAVELIRLIEEKADFKIC